MVEFVDYECPYCRRFFKGPYQKLKRDYIDPGMVRLVVVDMPLPFHRLARKAAQAAHCAGDQGRFWEMHDFLFGGSAGLTDGGLLAYAEQAKLDLEAFRACRDSDRHLERIDLDTSAARSAGITGTPAFIIGRSQGDRVSGPHIRGALPYRVFQGHIESLLEEAPEPL
jgi:protein-disulfide isomerase